jgi:23S rRNA pseudouridine2605 synthase
VAALGSSADPEVDEIRVDGERLRGTDRAYWLVNKPRGVLTTTRDPWAQRQGRRTVLDLLPEAAGAMRLFPVGRLDAESEGLVLLTNDGDLTQALLHPSLGNEREYRVTVRGRIGPDDLRRLRTGIRLEDGPTQPWRVRFRDFDEDTGRSRLEVVLREGRKRQIRLAFRALGHPVVRLLRTRMGPLRLGRLPAGSARALGSDEIRALRDHARRLQRGAAGKARSPVRNKRRQGTGGRSKKRF